MCEPRRAELAGVIRDLAASGELTADIDADEEARRLLVEIMGIAAQAAFDRADWPVKRQRQFVRAHLDRLVAGPAASAVRRVETLGRLPGAMPASDIA